MPFEHGPYLEAALICERVLEEKDGVKSVIRIVDRLLIEARGKEAPEKMPPFNTDLTLFIRFKSGMARGPFTLNIILIQPSGENFSPMQQVVHFEGEEDRGQDLINTIQVKFEMAGIYWFEIYLDDGSRNELMTKVPFRILYTPKIN